MQPKLPSHVQHILVLDIFLDASWHRKGSFTLEKLWRAQKAGMNDESDSVVKSCLLTSELQDTQKYSTRIINASATISIRT